MSRGGEDSSKIGRSQGGEGPTSVARRLPARGAEDFPEPAEAAAATRIGRSQPYSGVSSSCSPLGWQLRSKEQRIKASARVGGFRRRGLA
uniref:Uncharacterized protein n=1 Tax=Arundo donax TaxID=35708 RepID=A0A0A9HHQ9_ARUDO